MYVQKFTSFCQALKKITQKKTGSFFLPHGVEHWQIHQWRVNLLHIIGDTVVEQAYVAQVGAYPRQQVRSEESVDAVVSIVDGVDWREVKKQRQVTVALQSVTLTNISGRRWTCTTCCLTRIVH